MSKGREYFRIMLGKGSQFAEEAFKGGWIGAGYVDADFTGKFPDDPRAFGEIFLPLYRERHPDKSKVAAGLARGMLYTVAKAITSGDVVLCPDGAGAYRAGEVTGNYSYALGGPLPHRRPVRWFGRLIPREEMSEALRYSTGSIGAVANVTKHAEEIEKLIGNQAAPVLVAHDENVEDPSVFALERHLEDFLVANWTQTELGRNYDIFEDENGNGQQYPTDTGLIDILAVSKDRKKILVVELKKGRASDVVVGQIQRYMGYVLDELAEPGQVVRGIIIALEDDLKLTRALRVTSNIDFYRYHVSFQLIVGGK